MPDKPAEQASVIVVGGGPAGLTAAIALASAGIVDRAGGQAPGPARQPHHRPARRFRHGAGDAGRLAAVRSAGRAAAGDAHRRRHRPAVARAGSEIRSGRNRSRRLRLQHRKPPSGRRAGAARAPRLPACASIEDEVRSVDAGRRRGHGDARERRHAARAAGDRRRRPPLALPRGGRHRHRRARLPASRADRLP